MSTTRPVSNAVPAVPVFTPATGNPSLAVPGTSAYVPPANDNLPIAPFPASGVARLFGPAPVSVVPLRDRFRDRSSASADVTSPYAEPSVIANVTSPYAQPAGVDLDAALATVTAEKIKKDVYYVADDARAGRDTPSQGQTETANYIRERLQTHGWQPGAPNNSYLYTYELSGGWFDPVRTKLLMGGKPFAYGKDYFYGALANRTDVALAGDVVFVGNGAQEVYDGLNVNGRWVVVVDDFSIGIDERREAAKAAGAAGLIVLPHPDLKGSPFDKKLECLAHQAKDGQMKYSPTDGIDEIVFTRMGAEKFLSRLQRNTGVNGQTLFKGAPTLLASMSLNETRVIRTPFAPVNADNVVGFWKGADPELSKEVILITAHYDHLGKRGSTVYNGADDNGSGTSLLLQLVESVAKLNPKRSVMIMWVSGEEKGLLGSAAWVKKPYFPDGVTPIADINADMVGRNKDGELYVTPSSSHRRYNGLTKLAEGLRAEEGFDKLGSADEYYARSDHYEFAKLKDKNGNPIPIVFLTSGTHPDYHRPSDDSDKINYPKLARTARLIVRMLAELQAPE